MPEIDAGIFQWATLGLLAILIFLVLFVGQTLNQVKKLIEQMSAPSLSDYDQPAPSAFAQPAASAYDRPVATAHDEPAAVSSVFEASPAVAATTAAATTPAATEPVASAPIASQAAEPNDQPFEKDGRWWYQRGTELLVYDEQAAQWVPAPEESATTAAAPVSTMAPAATTTPEVVAPLTGEPAGAGWKCSSCGAVNGSTATSCRMCFAARA